MKAKIFTIVTSALISLSAPAQIPNSGFENWTTVGGYSNPDGWDNPNALTSSMSVYTCTKGTPGDPGASYLKLVSKTVTGFGVVPGIAVCGTIDYVSCRPKSGFASTQRPQTLTGNWQYMYGASASDVGFIAVYLTKWNTTNGNRDTIASAIKNLTGMAMSWAAFTVTLNYVSGATPDSAMIILSASGPTPSNGSYLYVDNLAFTGTVIGVEEVLPNSNFRIFPNPAAQSELTVVFDKATSCNVEIFSIEGKLVKQISSSINNNQFTVDIADLNKGYYFIKAITPQGSVTKKLVRE
ncbi:MAG: T9SS type A sorting domain-containing protein [Bacteroidia bacterium]